MLSPEYGLLFLAAGVFLLVVFLMTQIVPGRRPRDLLLDDETESTERFLRSISSAELDLGPREKWKIDASFNEIIRRADLKMSVDQALGAMLLTGVAAAVAMYFWQDEIWAAALGFFVGMALIFGYYYLRNLGYRRRIQNQLPDTLFLIARSVRAGMSLEQSIDLAAQQGVQPLAGEFRQAAQQIKLGLSVPAALQRLANRFHLLDFDAFVSATAIYARTGGNLPLMLDRLAANARDHNLFRGYFFATTAQARITAISIGLAAPLLLIAYLLLDPEHLQTFFKSETGYYIIAGCLILELIGAYWLYRMLKIDYY
jgi:tight adherence protein B